MNKKSFIWNMLGSGLYAAATFLFVMIAKRAAGVDAGEEFFMAFTTGQMLLTIGYFELRPFQSTDVKFAFSAGEYFSFRMISCLAMLLAGVAVTGVYALFDKASGAGLAMIMAATGYKMFDAVSDTYEGEFQRHERMDLSGLSMFLRVLAALVIFAVVCFGTKNVLLGTAAMIPVALLAVLFIDRPWFKKMGQMTFALDKKRLGQLLSQTLLLFLGSMMCMWIWNGTKYVVEWTGTKEETLVYGIIFMPTSVINLGSGFLLKPMLTTLANLYKDRRNKEFLMTIAKLCLGVLGITAAAAVGAWFLGIPVLNAFYGMELDAYKGELMVLICGGGMNALGIVLYYALTVMRRTKLIFVGYAATLILSIPLPVFMMKANGLMGISVSYLILMAVEAAVFFGMILIRGKE